MSNVSRSPRPGVASPAAVPFRLGHLTALDGLRGLAIMVVVLHIGRAPHMEGGHVGVDIFFVLSGFLITGLLLQEWIRTGSVSLPAFYGRRALRLLPALLVMLSIVLLVPWLFYAPARPWKDTLIAATYLTNWVIAFDWRAMRFFDHTWSLAVEVQFYLIWPVVLVLLLKLRRPVAWVLAVLGAGALASGAWRIALWDGLASVDRTYYGLDTRFYSLLVGGAVAAVALWDLIPRNATSRALIRVATGFSAVALVVAVSTPDDGSSPAVQHALSTIAVVATAVMLLHVVYCPSRLRSWALENRAMVWLGRISYGLYVWHDPVFLHLLNAPRMAKLGISSWGLLLGLRLLAVGLIASLSFYLIEQVFLGWKTHLGYSEPRDTRA